MKKPKCTITIEDDGKGVHMNLKVEGMPPVVILGHLELLKNHVISEMKKGQRQEIKKDLSYVG